MLFRKYLAFIDSTFPWVWVCLITWWIDRLFVEMGHRTIDNLLCTHSDLQYVKIHLCLIIGACLVQTVHSSRKRKEQFTREARIMGINTVPCLWHIYISCFCACLSWTIIIVCIVDVSPLLCIDLILQYRASLTLIAISVLGCQLPCEAHIWDRALQKSLKEENCPIDI